MFAQKIQSLQQRIVELEQQQQQYIALDTETNNALALISKIRDQAAALGEVETVSQMFLEVLQPASTTSPAPQEPELEARLQQVAVDFRRDTELCEVLEAPLPTTEELERRVEKVVGDFEDEFLLSRAMGLDLPGQEILEKRIQEVIESVPVQTEAVLIEEEISVDQLEKYLDPTYLQQALSGDDPELALMEIASLLDTSHQDDVEDRVRYFIEKLQSNMSDRIITYLPKTLALLWAETREKVEEEARESLFPPTAQIAIGDRVEIKKDGDQGTVSWVGQNSEGEPVASVRVVGGTRGGIPFEGLKPIEPNYEAEDIVELKSGEVVPILQVNHIGDKTMLLVRMPNGSPATIHPESVEKVVSSSGEQQPQEERVEASEDIESLAKQCLQLRRWSQVRVCCDQRADVIEAMQRLATTKSETRLINNLPSLILGFVERSKDKSDLEWLPTKLLSEVESLLAQPQQQSIA
jgi:hypothetical protein